MASDCKKVNGPNGWSDELGQLQFVYMGQAMRTAEVTQTQRLVWAKGIPQVPYSCSFGNKRKVGSSPACFHWITSPPGLAWSNITTITPLLHPPAAPTDHHHHICLQLAAKFHYKFLTKSAILTAVVQNTTQENGPSTLTARLGCSKSIERLLI